MKAKSLNLTKVGIIYIICFAVLLIPTVYCFIYHLKTGIPVSRFIAYVWVPKFYMNSGLNHLLIKTIIKSIFTIVSVCLGIVFYRGYRTLASQDMSDKNQERKFIKNIFLWFLLFGTILVFVAPFNSTDMYGYINRGAQQVFYNLNPYTNPLSSIHNWHQDLMFHNHWAENPAPYGFFYVFITKIICLLSGRHFLVAFMLFKIMNLLLYFLSGLVLYYLCRRLKTAKPWLSMYLFMLNPLLLLQVIGNGHNDIVLALFLLAAVAAIATSELVWLGLPLLVLSILTKYASLLALPFFIIYLFRQRSRAGIAVGGLLSVIILALLSMIYVPGIINNTHTLGIITENATLTTNSLHSAIYFPVKYLAIAFPVLMPIVEPISNFLKLLLWVAFAGSYLWLLVNFWKNLSYKENKNQFTISLVKIISISMVVMIVFVSSKFNSWYLGMFFPLLLLLDENSFLRRFGIMLSIFQISLFTPVIGMNIANFIIPTAVPFILVFRQYLVENNLRIYSETLIADLKSKISIV